MKSSGCDVPQFMLDMKNPSQREKKNLRLKPINRKDIRQSNSSGGTKTAGTRKVERKRVMGGESVIRAKREVVLDE